MMPAPALLASCRGLVLGVSTENGLGFQCARAFRALGAEVAATYRPARAPDAPDLLATAGIEVHHAAAADEPGSVAAAIEAIGSRFGRLDFLIHALVGVPEGVLARPLSEISRATFHGVLDATAYSLVEACGSARRWLERSQHPRVVALTSAAASRMTPNHHVVGIAKAALGAALLYLGAELGPSGVLCNGVAFSLVATDGARRALGDGVAEITRGYLAKKAPTRRAVEIEHVTNATAFFASPFCQNVTGEVLMVDGGYARTYL
jgi:enoyl-[acyl-carrier protein] reductase I